MRYRGALLGFSLTAALILLGAAPAFDAGPYVRAQRLVDVGHRRMNLYCTGSGSPVVVLDAGLGGTTLDWRLVQPAIARHTRVCSYDRAGMGFSDPGTLPRDGVSVVGDLNELLTNADVAAPYVLVGHSIAGMFVRLYADRYPDDVAGLVFIDPAVEYQDERDHALVPALAKSDVVRTQGIKACAAAALLGELHPGARVDKLCVPPPNQNWSKPLNDVVTAQLRHAAWVALASEAEAAGTTTSAQVRAQQRDYGSLPLIVLTATGTEDAAPVTKAQKIVLWNAWKQSHDRVAALSSRGVNVVVAGSGHYIHLDQPSAVISAIDEVVDQARATP